MGKLATPPARLLRLEAMLAPPENLGVSSVIAMDRPKKLRPLGVKATADAAVVAILVTARWNLMSFCNVVITSSR